MHIVQPEAGQRFVQPLRLVVGTGDGLVLNGQPRLTEQVDGKPGSSTTGGPSDWPLNLYARTVPNDVGTSTDSLTGGSSAIAAR